MNADRDAIARKLVSHYDFGFQFRGRNGKPSLESLKLAVGMVLSTDAFENPDPYSFRTYDVLLREADEALKAVSTLGSLDFTLETFEQLAPFDREHFATLVAQYITAAQEALAEFARVAADYVELEDEDEEGDDDGDETAGEAQQGTVLDGNNVDDDQDEGLVVNEMPQRMS